MENFLRSYVIRMIRLLKDILSDKKEMLISSQFPRLANETVADKSGGNFLHAVLNNYSNFAFCWEAEITAQLG